MKRVIHSLELTDEQLSTLIGRGKRVKYTSNTTLVYRDHAPTAAYLILNGPIYLKKRRSVPISVPPLLIIGLEELIHHLPLKRDLEVHQGAEVIVLDRSTLKEIIGNFPDDFNETLVRITNKSEQRAG